MAGYVYRNETPINHWEGRRLLPSRHDQSWEKLPRTRIAAIRPPIRGRKQEGGSLYDGRKGYA